MVDIQYDARVVICLIERFRGGIAIGIDISSLSRQPQPRILEPWFVYSPYLQTFVGVALHHLLNNLPALGAMEDVAGKDDIPYLGLSRGSRIIQGLVHCLWRLRYTAVGARRCLPVRSKTLGVRKADWVCNPACE